MDYTRGDARVTGFIGNPNTLRGSRSGQHTFVNRRFVRDRAVTRAIDEGYRSVQTIHGSKHPILVLNVEIDPSLIDVNVSPTKTEVRFTNERDVFSAVYHAIASALVTEGGLVQQGDLLGSPQVSETQSRNADRPVSQPLLDTPSSTPVTTRQYDSSYNRPSDRSFQADRNADISEFHNAVIERAGLSGAENTGNERDPLGDETQAPSYSYSGGAEQNRSDEVERSAYPPASPATERRENNGDSAPSKSPHRDKLTSLRVLAQTRNTYILAQTDTSLCIIDQHIAHERVLYERLLSGQASGILTMQHLMFPITLELGKKEALVTQARLGDLNKAGFLLEEFGSNSFLVRALPSAVAQGARAETVVREVIDELVEKTESRKLLVPAEEVLITASCKMAVKAGDPLTFDEMNGLLADLLQCENPYTCPHGRPIIVEIGNADMDRRFGR
jgi:DNA mismatch repair protein MutL